MTKTKFWRLAAPVLIPVTAGGLWPTVTSAGGTDPGPPAGGPAFTCRASVARVTTHGPLPALNVEPFVANRAGDPCVAESTGLLNDANLAGLGTASVAFARTGVSATHSTAESGVADITLGVAGQALRAQVLTSRATASCAAGQPVLTGSSRVVGLTVNGQPVDVPADNAPADVVLPAGVVVHLNQTVTTADQVTQRALFLDSPLVDIVVAESIADVHGCPPGPGGGNDGGGKGGGGQGGKAAAVAARAAAVAAAPSPSAPTAATTTATRRSTIPTTPAARAPTTTTRPTAPPPGPPSPAGPAWSG